MSVIESAVNWALSIANDNSHGYDQGNRWGPDYDCSSLVISAFKQAGVPLKSTYTGNMLSDFLSNGFSNVTSSVNLQTGGGLLRGDVLLNVASHTAMFIGNGKVVQACSNENKGILGGKTGDQTGGEICTGSYYNFPWNFVLRYTKESSSTITQTQSTSTSSQEIQNGSYLTHSGIKDMKWGIRRWRNPDGTLTDEGKIRYNYYKPKYDNRKGESQATKNAKQYQGIPGQVESALDAMKFGVRTKSISSKSDKELQEAIDRAKLEESYYKYFPKEYKTEQRQKLDKFLKIAGSALAIGVTASTIWSNLHTATFVEQEAYDKAAADKAVKNLINNTENISVKDFVNMDSNTLSSFIDKMKPINNAGTQLSTYNKLLHPSTT